MPARPSAAVICSGDLHNVGDLALLLQCAEGLQSRLGVERVAVRQWSTPDRQVLDQLRRRRITLLPGKAPSHWIPRASGALVMVGGGQMVRDNTSAASLVAQLAMMEWARATGGAAAVLACGVGDLKSGLRRRLWRRMLMKSTLVTVRDVPSQSAAAELASERPELTADLAFLPTRLHDALRRPTRPPALIVAPCDDVSERRGVDPVAVARLAQRACAALGTTRVRLAAHDARPGMDREVCGRMAAAISENAPELEVELLASYRLDDYLSAYASAAGVLTNRLHSAIFAVLAGRPLAVLDDGGAKTAAAAARFAIASTALSPEDDEAIVARLLAEARNGPSPERREALAAAEAGAERNFTLLRGALGLPDAATDLFARPGSAASPA